MGEGAAEANKGIWATFLNEPHDTICFVGVALGTGSRAWSGGHIFLEQESISKLKT